MIKVLKILILTTLPFNGITMSSSIEQVISEADSLTKIGETDQAVQLYQSINTSDIKSDTIIIFINEKIGNIYRGSNQFTDAYKHYILALEKSSDPKKKSVLNMKAGSVCGSLEQYDQALFHFNISLELAISEKNDFLISQSYNNIGLAYLRLTDYQKAKPFFIKSFDIRSKLDISPNYMGKVLNNLGLINEKLDNIDSAYYYYQLSYQIRKNNEAANYDVAESLQNIAYIKQVLGEYDSAHWYYNSAIKQVEGKIYAGLSQKIYGNLIEYFAEVRNYDSLRYYLDKFTEVEKVVYDEVTGKEVLHLNTIFQVSEKDRQIDTMGEENAQMTGQRNLLIAGSLLILIFSILLVLYLKQRQNAIKNLAAKNEEILHQKIDEILKDEELKSINAMLAGQESERKRIAQDLHDRLGSKLAAVKLHFESIADKALKYQSGHKLSDLIDEAVTDVRAIAHNMLSGVLDKFGLIAALNDLTETINLSGKLKVEFINHGIDDRFSGELELNLYRIIQELLANVLKHANASEVIIQLNKFDDELVMTVEDNGIGFDKSIKNEGFGLRNIASRVDEIEGRLHIDSRMGKGTSVTIEINEL